MVILVNILIQSLATVLNISDSVIRAVSKKTEKDDTGGESYNQILNVPLPYTSSDVKIFQLKKLFKDMFKENTIEYINVKGVIKRV